MSSGHLTVPPLNTRARAPSPTVCSRTRPTLRPALCPIPAHAVTVHPWHEQNLSRHPRVFPSSASHRVPNALQIGLFNSSPPFGTSPPLRTFSCHHQMVRTAPRLSPVAAKFNLISAAHLRDPPQGKADDCSLRVPPLGLASPLRLACTFSPITTTQGLSFSLYGNYLLVCLPSFVQPVISSLSKPCHAQCAVNHAVNQAS